MSTAPPRPARRPTPGDWLLDVPPGWGVRTWADAGAAASLRAMVVSGGGGARLRERAADDLDQGAAMVAWTAGTAADQTAVAATLTLHVGDAPVAAPRSPLEAPQQVQAGTAELTVTVHVSAEAAGPLVEVVAEVRDPGVPAVLIGRTPFPALSDALVRTVTEVAATFEVDAPPRG